MAGDSLDYRSAQDTVASRSPVKVERSVGGVVVRVRYPAGKFREALAGAIIQCVVLGAFPLPFLWFSGWSIPGLTPLAFAPWLLLVAFVGWVVIGRASRMGRSCTMRADRDGITIQQFRGRREWLDRLPRERIAEVRIGFSQAGRSGQSTAWIVIALKPWYRMNRTLLHDLGGDQLARAADAVRDGLGLEPVEWPSGRPRKPGQTSPGESRRRPVDRAGNDPDA